VTALDALTHPGMWPVWVAFTGLALYGAWEWLTGRAP
jgi:hypothetical protein